MAEPAFIYAFDNLGPYRFTELCGNLLGSQHRGFVLGGEGADGGIDGEVDSLLGIWQPEYEEALLTDIIQPSQTVIFQFKHKVSGRVGQIQSRERIRKLYECTATKKCELHSKLIQERKPAAYVLVTNIEVNSQWRNKFRATCKAENPAIQHYQVIGLDDLVSWVKMMPELRQLYFPTIFGVPQFNLRVSVRHSVELLSSEDLALIVDVMNIGLMPSYLDGSSPKCLFIINGKMEELGLDFYSNPLVFMNSNSGITLAPGRKYTYLFPQHFFTALRKYAEEKLRADGRIFPVEIRIRDDIDNFYRHILEEDQKSMILKWMYGEGV